MYVFIVVIPRLSIVSVRPYDSGNLTILSQYSFKVLEEDAKGTSKKMVTVTHSVLAQLPFAAVLSLSEDDGAVDVGPLLTQVHVLEPFKAGRLAVMGGTRKLAAVVRLYSFIFYKSGSPRDF